MYIQNKYSTCNVNLYMINDRIRYTHDRIGYTHDRIGYMINAKPDKRSSRCMINGFPDERKT